MEKAAEAFRTISEVADELDVPKHVLRFWEVKFPQIKPMKRGGGRRYYRPDDVVLLKGIRRLLYEDGYTIKGVQKVIREQGLEVVKVSGSENVAPTPQKQAPAVATAPSEAPVPAQPAATAKRVAGTRTARQKVEADLPVEKVAAKSPRSVKAAASPADEVEAVPRLNPDTARRLRQVRRELEICLHLLTSDAIDDDDENR